MDQAQLNWITSFIWGIADDTLRDVFVRGKYRDVILPMTVLRRLDAVLEPTKQAVLDMKAALDREKVTNQDDALRSAAGEAFYNTSPFLLRDLKSRKTQQTLKDDFMAYLDGFSPNVQDILKNFEFRNQIPRLSESDGLGQLIEKFLDKDINHSPRPVGELPRRRLAPGTIDMQRSIIGQRNDPEIYPQLAWLASNYKKIRIYREWSMETKSFLRQPQPSDMRNEVIEEDFSNLGLNLSRLRQNSRAKNAIIQHLRKLDEGLTDFDVSAAGGTVQIFFNEGDFVIPAPRLAYDREFAVDSEQPFSFLIATQPDEETNWGRRLQGEIRREIQTDPPPKFS
jgi:type I restriction-modification system DNA methylase subunit